MAKAEMSTCRILSASAAAGRVFALAIGMSFSIQAATYYIDTAGSNAQNGLSPASAWKTLASLSSRAFAPGDRILLKRGGVWNETLNVPASGVSGLPLTIGAYGNSSKFPIIDAQGLQPYNVSLSNRSFVTLQDLQFQGAVIAPLLLRGQQVVLKNVRAFSRDTPNGVTLNVTSQQRWAGAWIPANVNTGLSFYSDPQGAITALNRQVGSAQALSHVYIPWASPGWGTEVWNSWLMDSITATGATPMITWEPMDWGVGNPTDPTYSLDAILSGNFDPYITSFARAAAAWNKRFLLRFAHEMNGNWTPWGVGGGLNGNTPAKYVAAWRHVHDIFIAAGTTNAAWVWSPDGGPNLDLLSSLYPGDAYVDQVAIDQYNWGSASWQQPYVAIGPAYAQITAITAKTLFLAETGSAESGGDKAGWISTLFGYAVPALMPRIQGICWFDENKQRDWRINTSSTSLFAYSSALQSWGWSSGAPL